jgi:His-Xaa-Ser system radical SAM maturase HxsC
MITLGVHGRPTDLEADLIGRVALTPVPRETRADTIRVLTDSDPDSDLSGYLAAISTSSSLPALCRGVTGCRVDHLAERDIVLINRRGYVRTVVRHGSRSNSLFATDRCNSLCLMCSQPPREVDDEAKASELVRIVSLMDSDTRDLGITGGEPTLLGDGLLQVIAACKTFLPSTALHILSNGRRFWYSSYAKRLGAVEHSDLMIGIPVYSHIDSLHDYVVQARGAFDETIIGLQNLARYEIPVEIRVVIQRHTAPRLPELAEFIYRNLTFAAHVAFMGLEITGFAKANLDDLWIDPEDYSDGLETAVTRLAMAGMNVSVYNHQLCRIPKSLWPFCRQSISDWKNEFAPECEGCAVKADCGGFFAWNLRDPRARAVRPVVP